MHALIVLIKKYLTPFFTTRAAGIYILTFAIAIAAGTFIENDFGTSAAQKVVYKSGWFTFLLMLFGTAIIVNIYRFRMIKQKKWSILMFHAAIIVILLGAGVTRYFGFEGMMHIRENDSSNSFLSAETYLQFTISKGGQNYRIDEPVLFSSLGKNRWKESYLLGNDRIDVKVADFIPNPVQVMDDSEEGLPTLKIVIAGNGGREEYYLSQGDTKRVGRAIFNFNDKLIEDAVNIAYRNDSLLIKTNKMMTQMVMATQKLDTLYPTNGYHQLMLRSMYSDGTNNFVFGDFNPKASLLLQSESVKINSDSKAAIVLDLSVNGVQDQMYVIGQKGRQGKTYVSTFDDLSIGVNYGARRVVLPFSIALKDFIMERYPGTDNAASYASEVVLMDSRKNLEMDYRIYMNHILDYDGYRFFQSSFDNDELGTYLSVNHDFVGTWISYIGYILLTIGMILTLFSKKSRFYRLSQNIKKIRENSPSALILLLFLLGSPVLSGAQKVIDQASNQRVVDADHAAQFSKLVVQDFKGRMKPVHTLTREVMRKLARKEELNGLSADQIVIGMLVSPKDWLNVPMIKIGRHEEIQKKLGVTASLASYEDFFTEDGNYILKEDVRNAYNLQPVDRGTYDKELIKVDERINIANMVFSGDLFKLIPEPDHPNNAWISSRFSGHTHDRNSQDVADRFFSSYKLAVNQSMESGNYELPDQIISELANYQRTEGAEVIPSESKINMEILLNQLNVFNRLSLIYVFLGLAFLFFLFLSVFRPDANLSLVYKILFILVSAAFLYQTIGLGLRWYVSGRAPWSNGYESMIYIAWTTMLAGLLFTRKSFGGMAATTILAATVLMVASLSYLDPEITPLVPVLRSYWLTIHVALEAGSYGFLLLGAFIGFMNLILMILLTEKNKERIYRIVREMSSLSEMTLIGGLFMISIGTYLGGVWANESWGRYWGWDAKETWALVTILVYAFILHMRFIPKLQGIFAFNFASIFGIASVMMTYFGVNYYLSGLHSYAAGDPVPIPQWVYIAVASALLISALAWWKKRKYKLFT